MTWSSTRGVLADLIKDVTCKICGELERNSHTHPGCDHHFCHDCINRYMRIHYECPECNQPSFHGCADPNEPVNDIVSTISTFRALIDHTYTSRESLPSLSKATENNNAKYTRRTTQGNVFKSPSKVLGAMQIREEPGSPVVFASSTTQRPRSNSELKSAAQLNQAGRQAAPGSSLLIDTSVPTHTDGDRDTHIQVDENAYVKPCDIPKTVRYADAGGEEINRGHDLNKVSKITDESKPQIIINHEQDTSREGDSKDELGKGISENAQKTIDRVTTLDSTGQVVARPQSDIMNEIGPANTGKRKADEMANDAQRRHSYSVTDHVPEAQQMVAQRRLKRSRESYPPGRKKLSSHETAQRKRAFEARNAKGETKLHRAAIKGDINSVQRIVDNYLCDPNVKDNADWSPLHEACGRGYIEIMKILIQNGADVNQRGYKGKTPLHDAIDMNEIEATLLLLQNNADRTRLCDARKRPEDYCIADAMREAIAGFKEPDPLPLRIQEHPTTPTPAKRESSPNQHTHGSASSTPSARLTASNTHTHTSSSSHTHSANSNNRRERVPLHVMATAFKRRHAGPNPKPKKCSGGKMVLMQTGLETEAQLLFEKVTRKLNGHVANKFNSAVTHIIVSTDHKRRCKRTMKYLWAQLNELCIVGYQWVLDSEKASTWLPLEPYLVIGDRSTPNAPDRTTLPPSDPPSQLFYGVAFYFMENIDDDLYTPDIKDLVRLIKFGGGVNLAKPLEDRNPPKNTYAAFTICVEDDPMLQTHPDSARNVSWLFDCVSYSRILDREPPDG